MVSNHLSPIRASLSTLPTELLTAIIYHLEPPSAAILARVARRFTPLCESAIWREVRLSLNPHYGEQPLVQPFPRDARIDHGRWARSSAKLAEERHREGLREKVKKVMVRMDERRLCMVEKVVLVPRPGALVGILGFLDVVSSTVRALELAGPPKHYYEGAWRPTDYDTLDLKFLDVNLLFSSLTYLIIRKGAVRFPEFIALLCRVSPNLMSLDVDIKDDVVRAPVWEDTMVPDYPVTQLPITKLRQLRLAYSDPVDEWAWERNGVEYILLRSPLLQRVSVRYAPEAPEQGDWDDIISALCRYANLAELHLSCDLEAFQRGVSRVRNGREAFPAVRRLCLSMDEDLHFLIWPPCLPLLEALILEHVDGEVPKQPTFHGGFPESDPSPTMTPDFAAALYGSPRLRYIYSLSPGTTAKSDDVLALLADIENTGTLTGIVRSLHHKGEQLVHARILLHFYELPDDSPLVESCGPTVPYTAADGTECEKVYQSRPGLESAWQDFISYDGYTVPREILQAMRLAAGAGVGDWVDRGKDVGPKAWAVLADWRDAQLVAEEEESGSGSEAGSQEAEA